jgi:hypothetical protein
LLLRMMQKTIGKIGNSVQLGVAVGRRPSAFFFGKHMNSKHIEKLLMTNRTTSKAAVPPEHLLSTGNTLLNLACSGHQNGAWVPGSYVFIVGDSQSGKTFFGLTCLAEACQTKFYDKHLLIYDNVENGAQMDMEKFFGKKMAKRVQPPAGTKTKPESSEFVEDFYYTIDDLVLKGKPFIYILDSMDSLGTRYADRKFAEGKKATRTNTKAKGDYGDGKAKINSTNLRRVVAALEKTDSILIIINQTRDNVDAGIFEAKKTRSGGHALKFYATTEIWTSVSKAITKTYMSRDVKIGGHMRAVVKKNRLNGRERDVLCPIYYDHGFDDIGGCVDWLLHWKHWTKDKSGKITAPELGCPPAFREVLIQHVFETEQEHELTLLVEQVWHAIEAKVAVKRPQKYD